MLATVSYMQFVRHDRRHLAHYDRPMVHMFFWSQVLAYELGLLPLAV